MPEPVNINVTALVAAEEQARRGAQSSGERGIDILVVDDQPDHEAGWFSTHLPGHRRLSMESVTELDRFLAGQRLPNLPEPPYKPELAILDLSLGVGQRDGLQALHTLRRNPATRDLPAILNTNGLEDYRDLLAVLAAQINGFCDPGLAEEGCRRPVRARSRPPHRSRQRRGPDVAGDQGRPRAAERP